MTLLISSGFLDSDLVSAPISGLLAKPDLERDRLILTKKVIEINPVGAWFPIPSEAFMSSFNANIMSG